MYALVCTRTNISQVVLRVLSKFMVDHGCEHYCAVKSIYRYLQRTFEYFIFHHSNVPRDQLLVNIQGYVDFYWGGDVDRRRSTSTYALQHYVGTISQIKKQQAMVSLSTIKVKYMESIHTCKDAICLMKLCLDQG